MSRDEFRARLRELADEAAELQESGGYKLVSEQEYRKLRSLGTPELIRIACHILELDQAPELELPETQSECLGILLGHLRARLAELDRDAERIGCAELIVTFQERLMTASSTKPQQDDRKPEWVSQAFWDATNPRLP